MRSRLHEGESFCILSKPCVFQSINGSCLLIQDAFQVEVSSPTSKQQQQESLLANMQERLVQTEHGTVVLSTTAPPNSTGNTGIIYVQHHWKHIE